MITGVHALIYSRDAEAASAFFRDIFKWKSVDAGDGWLTFMMPPSEIAVHPSHTAHGPELYLMCDDIQSAIAELEAKGVKILGPVTDQGYILITTIRIPGNIEMGLYQPLRSIAVPSPRPAPSKPTTAPKTEAAPEKKKR